MFGADGLFEEFSESTLSRARALWRQGKVLAARLEEGRGGETVLRGKVRGSSGETYRQTVEFVHEDGEVYLFGECTCPVGFNCKHVAALLLAVMEAERGGERAPPPQTLPRELEAWLMRAQHAPQPEGFSTNHRLLYVLSLAQTRGGQRAVTLEFYSGRLGKDGFTAIKPFSNAYNAPSLPQYAQREVDLLKTAQACLKSGFYSSSGWALDDLGLTQHLLKRLAATGRLFWGTPGGEPLSLGDVRPAKAAWRMGPDGVQVPHLEASPPAEVALPLSPPWYVDPSAHLLGPLKPDLPAEHVKLFLSCPPVAPEVLPRFLEGFREVAAAALPAPQPLKVERRRVPCVPRLVLASGPLPNPYGTPERTVDTAALEFRYGEAVVPATDKAPQTSRYRDGTLQVLARDPDAERRAGRRLADAGFVPLGRLAYGVPESKQHLFTLVGDEKAAEGAWLAFVREALPTLRAEGWEVVLEDSFRYKVVQPEDWYGELEEGEGWFGLELGVVVEGRKVPIIPLLVAAIRQFPGTLSTEALAALPEDETLLIPFEGHRLALSVSRLRPILSVLLELYLKDALAEDKLRLPLLDAARVLELEEALALRWLGGERLRDLGRRLRDFSGVQSLPPPAGLRAALRPYQQRGLEWLQFLREYDLNGVLADDMGLGKTVQTLAHLLTEKEAGRAQGPSLVVAPTSLMHTWRAEAARFAPDLEVLVLHGKERKARFGEIPEHDLVLTTYPLVLRDVEVLKRHTYHLLVLDEAQYVKNPRTGAFKAVAGLPAKHRLCLSGTPLENHLGELWALFHFLMPGFLGSSDQFRDLYRTPIERAGDGVRQQQLARRVKPFILRRTKGSVAKELPPKSDIVVGLELEGAQRDLYETLRAAVHARVRQEVDKRGLARSQIVVLDALLKLRQACCDPRLVGVKGAEKVRVSAKLEWLKATLPNMMEEGRKVLLFSQFATLLGLLEETLADLNVPYAKLTGRTKDRSGQIHAFQEGEARVFLVSLKAGGVGLNLTAADTVIHYDPWWNPAAENQATDRAHRIGQDKPVFVYKLIASGSIEEKILALQARKAALAQGILSGSLGGAVGLTQEDLGFLFEPLETATPSPKGRRGARRSL